jgi:hypothetical protein
MWNDELRRAKVIAVQEKAKPLMVSTESGSDIDLSPGHNAKASSPI